MRGAKEVERLLKERGKALSKSPSRKRKLKGNNIATNTIISDTDEGFLFHMTMMSRQNWKTREMGNYSMREKTLMSLRTIQDMICTTA